MGSRRVDDTLAKRGGLVEILRAPAALFAGIARGRAWLYDRRLLSVKQVPVPVISVGNLAVGGTGKTPMVAFLVRALQAKGFWPGVLARGYGSQDPGRALNDEGRMLQAWFPELPQVQNPNRVQGALALVEQGVDCILLDDGFQHRRLHRDFDLVLIDASRPFGLPPENESAEPVAAHMPRGFLREGLAALRRANFVVLTRCDQASKDRIDSLTAKIRGVAPEVPIGLTGHGVESIWQIPSDKQDPSAWAQSIGSEVDLISAIGNPKALESTVCGLGLDVRRHRVFSDHHTYSAEDVAGLGDLPVLTTAKDWPKLEPLLSDLPWQPWVVEVALTWESGREELLEALSALPLERRSKERASLHAGLHG